MPDWTVDDASNDTAWSHGNSWDTQDSTTQGDGEWEDIDLNWDEYV